MADARGPLSRWLAPATWLMARAYGAGVAYRNARFDRGVGVHRLEVDGVRPPVVSVGNLTAGGTGKSPFVAWIAREIAERGAKPVIAMRGYRGSADGAGGVKSDEALEYASTAPDAVVVVGARRREMLRRALADATWLDRAVIVLDDGFQHRGLARDLDIVLVDATRTGLDGDLLPNGWLREPARAIRRAGGFAVAAAQDDRRARSRTRRLVHHRELLLRLVGHRLRRRAVRVAAGLRARALERGERLLHHRVGDGVAARLGVEQRLQRRRGHERRRLVLRAQVAGRARVVPAAGLGDRRLAQRRDEPCGLRRRRVGEL
ncbi:MAG: tetraacyldisaccharide 4'-kinase, partial [Phycisphaerales bacterium]